MITEIENIKKSRQFLLDILKDLSVEQLNKVPEAFNNNIIWNLGHMVAAQQGICYMRSGLPIVLEDKYFTDYKPGSKPNQFIDANEVQKIKDQMFTSLDMLLEDIRLSRFANYTTWTTRYGVELSRIEDAINFLPYHEGLHSGTIMSLKKLV